MSRVPYDSVANASSEFGRPAPRFRDDSTRNTTSLDADMSQSHNGSLTALKPYGDGHNTYPPDSDRYYMDGTPRYSNELTNKERMYEAPKAKSKRKTVFVFLVVAGLLIVAAAVALPVYFLVIKPKQGGSASPSTQSSTGGSTGSTPAGGNGNSQTVVTSGGDGSTVTKDDGTTFVYKNSFGGLWVQDPANPLNNSARAQSWVPPLSEPWKFGQDKIFGVNLGGWLTLEPFIAPALYQPFDSKAVDEWTLSTLLRQRDGNLNAIEDHYKTFITEEDFAEIAAAGLSWVRIPLPFWAIETYPGEPFLPKVAWTYFLKAIQWARKYGIRINLDLHTVPGSQNGWNHSGMESGDNFNFLKGVMGVANGQRALDYIRILAEFISQPEYKNVIPFFGIINEPRSSPTDAQAIPPDAIKAFYAEAYKIIRNAGGNGAGNGPIISIYDAFLPNEDWNTFLPGADRLALDNHQYMIFGGGANTGPPSDYMKSPCSWGSKLGDSMNTFGLTAAGEWSLAFNDCGLFLNSVVKGSRLEGTMNPAKPTEKLGDCGKWADYQNFTPDEVDAIKNIYKTSIEALDNSFFWTWRIGESTAGKVEAPFWSYKIALEQGWALKDPRQAAGACASLGVTGNTYQGSLKSWQIGADATYNVPALDQHTWPPKAISGIPDTSVLPTYVASGPIPTLAVPTFTQRSGAAATAAVSAGNGWSNPSDTALMAVPVAACTYPDAWFSTLDTPIPPACAAGP